MRPPGGAARAFARALRAGGIVALLGLAPAGCKGPTTASPANWQLVWQDDFDGPLGTQPDAARWRYDIGTDWGNGQLEFDTARPENVALDGAGHLAITALKESYQGREYTSARINTLGLFEQTHGRLEARIKLPVGRGIWPAFWLLGSNFGAAGWPACGEIDIMEYRGQESHLIHGSLHGPGYSGGGALTSTYDLPGSPGFDQEFHRFAVEWSENRITWMVDDTRYLTIRPSELPPGGSWVFEHPFFIILDVAVGGNFVGAPDANTAFPQTMLVDWVRVYREGS